MATQTAQHELLEYFTQLSNAEQESFLSLIKTVIANKEPIGIKQYNDELEQAVQEFIAIILAERCRRTKRAATAEAILDHFREHFRRKKINA